MKSIVRNGLFFVMGFVSLIALTACQTNTRSTVKMVYPPVGTAPRTISSCRIACYSEDAKGSLYPAGNHIYVHGFVVVPGDYDKTNICRPVNAERPRHISGSAEFTTLCKLMVKSCGNHCWAGGDA